MRVLFFKSSNRIRESTPLEGGCIMLCARWEGKLQLYTEKERGSFINKFYRLFRDYHLISRYSDHRLYLRKVERGDGSFFCLSRLLLCFFYLTVAVTRYRSWVFTVRDKIIIRERRVPDPQERCRIELQSEQNQKRYRNEFFHLFWSDATNVRIL
jgi:hypothetical protein